MGGGGFKEGQEIWVQQEKRGRSCIPALLLWPCWRILRDWDRTRAARLFLPTENSHQARGFWDKSLRDPLGVCLFRSPPGRGQARGGCSGVRFVTLCVFSPLSPLLPAPLQVPSSPRYLRIRQPNLEIINLEWDHPEHPNGVITGYTLRYQPCTSHVLLSVINQGILPFLLFPRAGRSMRNWRLPWWDKPVLGGVLDICSGGGGCSAAPQNQILRENQLDLGFRKILGAA